jgi:hypothetical protein
MTDPTRIIVAGDWHANLPWAVQVVKDAATILADEPQPLILQLGDFGIWGSDYGRYYTRELVKACRKHKVKIWFLDGNHEEFPLLHNWEDGDPIRWLPRGTRWSWHDRTWLAVGGGVSLDKKDRREGVSWFPGEEITPEQELKVIMDGPAEVMVTHDCPRRVTVSLPGLSDAFWDPHALADSNFHQQRLERVVEAVHPQYLMHGHMHTAAQKMISFGYGPCEVTSLDMDGARFNAMTLDVKTMEWAPGI